MITFATSEKNKSLLDDEKFQKKLAKLSPTDRAKLKQDILENEKERRKMERAEERLMRMPKEQRLKAICKKHLLSILDFGKTTECALRDKKTKRSAIWWEHHVRKQMGYELTMDLKNAKVLPLEG